MEFEQLFERLCWLDHSFNRKHNDEHYKKEWILIFLFPVDYGKQCKQVEYQLSRYKDTYILCTLYLKYFGVTQLFHAAFRRNYYRILEYSAMNTFRKHVRKYIYTPFVLHDFELVVRLNLTQNGFGLT